MFTLLFAYGHYDKLCLGVRVDPRVASVTQLVAEGLPSMHNLESDSQHCMVVVAHSCTYL